MLDKANKNAKLISSKQKFQSNNLMAPSRQTSDC